MEKNYASEVYETFKNTRPKDFDDKFEALEMVKNFQSFLAHNVPGLMASVLLYSVGASMMTAFVTRTASKIIPSSRTLGIFSKVFEGQAITNAGALLAWCHTHNLEETMKIVFQASLEYEMKKHSEMQ